MAYGSFNLFNFFQQPNTGSFPTTQEAQDNIDFILYGGNGQSGTVTDSNWYFPYAFSKVPTEVIQGQGASYDFPLLSDTLDPAQGGQGLHWGQIHTNFSGDFWNDLNTSFASASFSGDFQPLIFDLGGMQLTFSGDFQGFPSGLEYVQTLLTGDCVADNLGVFNFALLFSGDFWKDFNLSYINTINSGNIIPDTLSQVGASLGTSGSFDKILSDSTNLTYGFNNSYENGSGIFVTIFSGNFNDLTNLTYSLLTYSRGG